MRVLLLLLLLVPGLARAAGEGWEYHLGATVPLAAGFRDEAGRNLVPGALLGDGVPVLLDLGYFHCPALCGIARADLLAALATADLRPGRDYRLLVVSIDPAETPRDAAAAKEADLRQAGLPDGSAWHYLTAPAPAVAAVADAAGFRFRFDEALHQFIHPAGVTVLTGDGLVSGYLGGVGYDPARLRAALDEAAHGGIAAPSLPILLLCHLDPVTGRYTLAIEKVLRWMAVLTVLTLGGTLWALNRGGPRA